MNNSDWISVEDELPATMSDKYGQVISKRVPVIVDGRDGWYTGYFNEFIENDYSFWTVEGMHGDKEVTYWLNLPEFPK